jgi:hypothetical protein
MTVSRCHGVATSQLSLKTGIRGSALEAIEPALARLGAHKPPTATRLQHLVQYRIDASVDANARMSRRAD